MDDSKSDLSRRRMLQLTAGAAAAVPFVELTASDALAQARKKTAAAKAPRFFTKAEFELVDELSDMIIPTDEVSAGARAAGVAAYLDGVLAEIVETDQKDAWRTGIKALDTYSTSKVGKPFMAATPAERVTVLTELSKNEFDPKTPEEKFFRQAKEATARVYYSSEIGIQKDIGYKGNSYLQEFVGTDVSPEGPIEAANVKKS